MRDSIGTCDDCGAENVRIWQTEYNWQCEACMNDNPTNDNAVSPPTHTGETQWQCSTCGARFPHTRGDEDVAQCSKCVEVEVLSSRVRALLAERDRLRAALERADALVKVVRWAVDNHYAPPPLCDALDAYDDAALAGEGR